MSDNNTTDFGFTRVDVRQKTKKVGEVFSSVASRYDVMNDVMSFGVHRLWKQYAVHIAAVKPGDTVLDLAGGTGDISEKLLKRVGNTGTVLLADINHEMLLEARSRFINKGVINNIDYLQVNAESLPFADNSLDFVSMAFGLRNVTDKVQALRSIFRCLKYGSQLMVLEFSKLSIPVLQKIYDQYSFKLIPLFGKLIANDEASYQYLVESIRMHPDQETLKSMMEEAGFSRVRYQNLTAGVVSIHTAYKL